MVELLTKLLDSESLQTPREPETNPRDADRLIGVFSSPPWSQTEGEAGLFFQCFVPRMFINILLRVCCFCCCCGKTLIERRNNYPKHVRVGALLWFQIVSKLHE